MTMKVNDIIFVAFINLKIVVFTSLIIIGNATIFKGYAIKIMGYATKIDGVI